MFCKHCGASNSPKSSFCGSCGKSLKENSAKKESNTYNLINKFKELPKKTKIIMLSVIFVVIIAFIVLIVLLNNPVKKVEDNLANYYYFYNENRTKELLEIGKILKNNKDDAKVLNNIKETTHKITLKWVKNFNTSYKNMDTLKTNYEKTSKALTNLYNYYKGLDYILDYELYKNYMEELDNLYNSKKAFFDGEENKAKENAYYAYYYYQKVIEDDFYYTVAKKYIDEYVKDEVEVFKENINNILNREAPTNEDKLKVYYESFNYLKENKVSNNIDLSITTEYKELYNDIIDKILETTKLIIDTSKDNLEYTKCLEIINETLEVLDNEELKEYQELLTLKENYEEKKPFSLLERNLISSTTGSSHSKYTRIINNTEYDSYISFKNTNLTESRVYNLNKEYQIFKTSIIINQELANINGTIKIYGDEVELYQSDANNLENIEINVTNVETLKIEFIPDNTSLELNDFNIYLVKPYLYK